MTSLLDGLVSMVAQEALKYTVLSGRRTVMHEALVQWTWIGNRSVCACGGIYSCSELHACGIGRYLLNSPDCLI